MSSQQILHTLVLHLYQPPTNLQDLLWEDEAELQRILKCYERIARYAHLYADVAQLHVVFSVPLLQQLKNPAFIRQTRQLEDIPAILESFRNAPNIEFIASGYQHAPLPLIPTQDWYAQLRNERSLIEETFGHRPRGYYPPGGLFNESMIPYLIEAGYEFALLPGKALIGEDGNPVDPYRVYQLKDDFIIVPIDEGFSQAQEHFIETPWFADEVINGTGIAMESASPYLVTTSSDGENGEWFRRIDEENGFFGHFFSPYMEFCETGEYPIRPVNLAQYLQHSRPLPVKLVEQDNTTLLEHPALKQLKKVSDLYWAKVKKGDDVDSEVRERLLQVEGSCYVLDQGLDHKKLSTLLDDIHDLLEPPKPGKTVKATGDTAADKSEVTPPAEKTSTVKHRVSQPETARNKEQANKPASTAGDDEQIDEQASAVEPAGCIKKATKKSAQGKKKVAGSGTKTAKKKTPTNHKSEEQSESPLPTAATNTRNDTASSPSSTVPKESSTVISNKDQANDKPVKSRKKEDKSQIPAARNKG